jgi:hypothetical protein
VFDCGRVALGEDRLNLDRESGRSDLGRIASQPEVIRFTAHAARRQRSFRVPSPLPVSDPVGLNLLLIPREYVLRRDAADDAVQTDVSEDTVGRGGGFTVRVIAAVCVKLPDEPVIVTVAVPVAAVLLAKSSFGQAH